MFMSLHWLVLVLWHKSDNIQSRARLQWMSLFLEGVTTCILQMEIKTGFCMTMSILNSYWFSMENNGEKILNNLQKCKPSIEWNTSEICWSLRRNDCLAGWTGMCIHVLWRKDGRLQWSTAFQLWYKVRSPAAG